MMSSFTEHKSNTPGFRSNFTLGMRVQYGSASDGPLHANGVCVSHDGGLAVLVQGSGATRKEAGIRAGMIVPLNPPWRQAGRFS